MVYGVLLDTVSIQQYIFSTNSLKENLGASYLVEEIYKRPLLEAIRKVFSLNNENIDLEYWHKRPEMIAVNNGARFEIGYIGGGNAFILFKEEEKAREFVKEWSKKLLVECPGLIPSSAIGEIALDNFADSLSKLFKKLSENKAAFIPQTRISGHGITADCSRTGYTREVWEQDLPEEEQDYISSGSSAKIKAARAANDEHKKLLKEINAEVAYTFSDKVEELGQIKGESNYIAIVHIDGNDMGNRFREQKSLSELRKLSWKVKEITRNSFKNMFMELIKNIEKEEEFNLKDNDGKKVLPVRPIIIGGDDVTFISEGRLGIWLAKVFLENFEKESDKAKIPLTACAGIAVTKTKYPFYRGYRLAEELTKNAKTKRKNNKSENSWLDFHIFSGGFSKSLSEIRETHYKTADYYLFMRPYSLTNFNELLRGVARLKSKNDDGKGEYSRSTLMKLREALYMGATAAEVFKVELESKNIELPEYKDGFEKNRIFIDQKTPYLDMIELMDFYPDFAL